MPDAPPFELFYASQDQDDLDYWRHADKQVSRRIERLLDDMVLHPFAGIGKPEPLRHQLAGYWSRRITGEHRIVYKVVGDIIFVAQCRFHY